MSEQDQQRPLTRRELRLREMGETGALDLSEVQALGTEVPDPQVADEPQTDELDISPLHEDGTPRSRREMRQLREEALAARAESGAGSEPSADPVGTDAASGAEASEAGAPEAVVPEADVRSEGADPAPASEAEALEETAAAADPATPLTGEIDFDSVISPPTEPFTVEELREAEQNADAEPEADTVPPVPAPKSKLRFPWKRSRADEAESAGEKSQDAAAAAEPDAPSAPADAAAAEDGSADAPAADAPATPADECADAPEAEAENAATEVAEVPEVVEVEVVEAEVIETAPEPIVPAPDTAADLPVDAEPEPLEDAPEPTPAEEPVAAPVSAKPTYSFPDIAPPEEWRSVFDDPAGRNLPTRDGAESEGDFDDLISRAVAQEGATGSSNTSALILPTMPEDTGGLTGPLGGTGELYVTGSLKLPKSLGETGGHSALHDSIEIDPITGAETDDPQITGQGPAPVSARHAVSARMDSSIPVVAKPAKERSKLPLVLSLTGGGLLVAVVAVGIWGASNGVFG